LCTAAQCALPRQLRRRRRVPWLCSQGALFFLWNDRHAQLILAARVANPWIYIPTAWVHPPTHQTALRSRSSLMLAVRSSVNRAIHTSLVQNLVFASSTPIIYMLAVCNNTLGLEFAGNDQGYPRAAENGDSGNCCLRKFVRSTDHNGQSVLSATLDPAYLPLHTRPSDTM